MDWLVILSSQAGAATDAVAIMTHFCILTRAGCFFRLVSLFGIGRRVLFETSPEPRPLAALIQHGFAAVVLRRDVAA